MNDDGESYPAVVSSYAILGDVTEIKVFIYYLIKNIFVNFFINIIFTVYFERFFCGINIYRYC